MRTARQIAKRAMQVAKQEFGLKMEKEDLFSTRLGHLPLLELAARIVMYEEELRFRMKHPQLIHHVQNGTFDMNTREIKSPAPANTGVDKTQEVCDNDGTQSGKGGEGSSRQVVPTRHSNRP